MTDLADLPKDYRKTLGVIAAFVAAIGVAYAAVKYVAHAEAKDLVTPVAAKLKLHKVHEEGHFQRLDDRTERMDMKLDRALGQPHLKPAVHIPETEEEGE